MGAGLCSLLIQLPVISLGKQLKLNQVLGLLHPHEKPRRNFCLLALDLPSSACSCWPFGEWASGRKIPLSLQLCLKKKLKNSAGLWWEDDQIWPWLLSDSTGLRVDRVMTESEAEKQQETRTWFCLSLGSIADIKTGIQHRPLRFIMSKTESLFSCQLPLPKLVFFSNLCLPGTHAAFDSYCLITLTIKRMSSQ